MDAVGAIDVGQAMATHLLRDTGILALTEGRVYPLRLPLGVTLPALTYQQISGPRDYTLDRGVAVVKPRVQVTCWAATYGAAKGLAQAVKASVPHLLGTISNANGQLEVTRATVENETDLDDPQTQTYGVAVDVIVWHRGDL